jgi:hypothetical protein
MEAKEEKQQITPVAVAQLGCKKVLLGLVAVVSNWWHLRGQKLLIVGFFFPATPYGTTTQKQ